MPTSITQNTTFNVHVSSWARIGLWWANRGLSLAPIYAIHLLPYGTYRTYLPTDRRSAAQSRYLLDVRWCAIAAGLKIPP